MPLGKLGPIAQLFDFASYSRTAAACSLDSADEYLTATISASTFAQACLNGAGAAYCSV